MNLNRSITTHLRPLVALPLAGLMALAGCSSDSDDDSADKESTTTEAESSDATEPTDTTETTEATGPVVKAEWKDAGDPVSSDKAWAVQKAKIDKNVLTLYLYTWEPTTTTPDWPWPEASDYGDGDFFVEIDVTAPGDLFQPAVYKDDQVSPSLNLSDLGVNFLVPNGEVQVTSIDGLVTGELRIDDGYAKITGSFSAMLED